MEFTRNMQMEMERAVRLVKEKRHRYFMPEHLVYGMTYDEKFSREFVIGGGEIKRLRADLLSFLDEHAESARDDELHLTTDTERVLYLATGQAMSSNRAAVGVSHLLSAILSLRDSYGVYFLNVQEVDMVELLGELSRKSLAEERGKAQENSAGPGKNPGIRQGPGKQEPGKPGSEKQEPDSNGTKDSDKESAAKQDGEDPEDIADWLDDEFGDDEEDDFLNKHGMLFGKPRWMFFVEDMNETSSIKNPLIGREEELERTIQILCRKDKNNVLHIGEPGVGKTAIAYGLARRLAKKDVPEPLIRAHLYSLDVGGLLAGTQYRGDFEKRFKEIIEGLMEEEDPILYLDEIHNLVGAGSTGGGSLDAANLLKPYMGSGFIRFIGATTYEEYKKYFSKNKSLVRRFQNVDIKEPTKAETVRILKGLQSGYEKYHGVKYGAGALEHAVELSSRFINERFLPDKAIDLMDEAGAYRSLHPLDQKRQTVGKGLIEQVLAKTCNIPVQTVEKEETEKLASLETHLKSQIFGQDEAVAQVTNAVKFSRAGLNEENKPVASFLFVGPTGVGKTELSKVLAQELGVSFIRFDMSEYAEKHTVAKLIGSPAGYVGYDEGGILTEQIRRHPHGVLLLDEIEKAHPDIFNVLLQVMDYATLTDNQGRKADFRNIILIMTSNAGAAQIGKGRIGFGGETMNMDALDAAVKKTFQPEFRNRLSKIVLFRGMDEEMAGQITAKKLQQLSERLKGRKVKLEVTKEAAAQVKQAGITREYGAREIDRVIAGEIKPLLAELLLFGKLKKGGSCILDTEEGKLVVKLWEHGKAEG